MGNILPIHLQEVVLSSSDPRLSAQISKLEKEGKLKKIALRINTSNFEDTPENIIRRNIFFILGKLYGALRRLTTQQDPDPYIRMLQRALDFSETIVGDDMDSMENILYRRHAFKEHNQGKLRIIKI